MTYKNIEFAVQDQVAVLTWNRPDSLNSFTTEMHVEIRDAIEQIEDGETARCLLITGSGRGFCAGQDLSDEAMSGGGATPDLSKLIEDHYNPLVRTLTTLPMPVICAVNGVAAGAGANIALACDIVLAARSASFIQVFSNIGLVPDSGGTWALPHLVGHARAMALCMLGEKVSAEKAEQWGMIWRCVDDDALQDEAMKLARHLAIQPTLGLALTKQALHAAAANSLSEQLDLERDLQGKAGRSDDYREGVAAFMEKRKPQFTGR